MQNKGFVRVFAILLTLVCVFYLSFSFVTRHYTNKAKEFAKSVKDLHADLSVSEHLTIICYFLLP